MSKMENIATGIDIGSRTTKIVSIDRNGIRSSQLFETGHNPASLVKKALEDLQAGTVVATGYGRKLAQSIAGGTVVTEIRACAKGISALFPEAVAAVDIGGQDAKAIALGNHGAFDSFEMNDRCAAGTGRFLEVMAKTLGYPLEEFGGEALSADSPVMVNSMCTVFAESEVISMISRGEERRRIALGLHMSIAKRTAAMTSRVYSGGPVAFAGGVARNECIVKLLGEELNRELLLPEAPSLTVAYGAALIGLENHNKQ